MQRSFLILFLFFIFGNSFKAQDTASIRQKAPHVFVDCKAGCDLQYIRSHLPYMNFVADMRSADVYIMITSVGTGSGGNQVSLFSTNEKTNHTDTMQVYIPPNTSDGISRDLILKKIKIILLPYVVASPLADLVSYDIELEKKETDKKPAKDKWNSWVCNINLRGGANGQSYRSSYNFSGRLGLTRVTEKSKFDISGFYNYNYVSVNSGQGITTGFTSEYGAANTKAFSLGNHFSTGYYASYFSSSPNNLRGNTSFFPAIEYNVFPYSKATRKVFRVLYRAGIRYQDYFSETIFDKNNLTLYPHALLVDYMQIEKWGTIDVTVSGMHYLNQPDYYNLAINPTITLNPFKGFRLTIFGIYAIVNDQFYLSKEGASYSQILLQQKQLKTKYTFSTGIGLSYTFGSIYNNVVNVRMDLDRNFW